MDLESGSDRERLQAMKKLTACVGVGIDVASLFPSVVKNVISPHLEIKRLVYMFLIHYADKVHSNGDGGE